MNQALYAQYMGRVIFQQAGTEILDAYRDFLKDAEAKELFKILDDKYRDSFWEYFTNDATHTFYSTEDGAKLINTPWWTMQKPPAS